MNVLVTGASGLVGNAICMDLLSRGATVYGITNNSAGSIQNPHFFEIKTDLSTNYIKIDKEFNCVIHCSALIPAPGNQISPDELFNKNQGIDCRVFSYCLEHKIKLIYFSTAFLYENVPGKNIDELDHLNKNPAGYYKSKKKSEETLVASPLEYTIFRLSSPYGNLTKQFNVMRLFSDLIKDNFPVTLTGKGERRQNFIHTEDISGAAILALQSSKPGIYNLAYDRSYSMLELAMFIKEIYNSKSEFIFDAGKTDAVINTNFDNFKLKAELGWIPKNDLQSGLIKTLLH